MSRQRYGEESKKRVTREMRGDETSHEGGECERKKRRQSGIMRKLRLLLSVFSLV